MLLSLRYEDRQPLRLSDAEGARERRGERERASNKGQVFVLVLFFLGPVLIVGQIFHLSLEFLICHLFDFTPRRYWAKPSDVRWRLCLTGPHL